MYEIAASLYKVVACGTYTLVDRFPVPYCGQYHGNKSPACSETTDSSSSITMFFNQVFSFLVPKAFSLVSPWL